MRMIFFRRFFGGDFFGEKAGSKGRWLQGFAASKRVISQRPAFLHPLDRWDFPCASAKVLHPYSCFLDPSRRAPTARDCSLCLRDLFSFLARLFSLLARCIECPL
jgi:hypothetical protein